MELLLKNVTSDLCHVRFYYLEDERTEFTMCGYVEIRSGKKQGVNALYCTFA